MARTQVYSGDCGYSATIDVVRLDDKHVQVLVHSECEQIAAMNPDLSDVQWKGKGHQVFKALSESVVYRSAAKHIRHQGCPIPAAIIKTIEVEVGIALPQDVTIKFVSAEDDEAFDSSATN